MKTLSYSLSIKLDRLFAFFFISGTLLAIFETIVSPHPNLAKNLKIFPSFEFLNFTFTVFEFFSLFFLALFIFFIIFKSSLNSKFLFAFSPSKTINFLILIFFINTILAIVVGVIEKNEQLIRHMRNLITLLVIFPFYYYREIIFKFRKFVFISINIVGLYFVIFTLIEAIYGYTLFTLKFTQGHYGLYFSGFFLAYHLFKILIEKRSYLSFFFIFLTLLCFSIRLTQKPVILEILVILCIVFMVSKLIFKKKIYKILIYALLGCLIIYPFLDTYYKKENQLAAKSLQRWTKVEVNLKNDELTINDVIENINQIEVGGPRDVSAKRFAIWKTYFYEGIKYPIVTPYFGTAGPDIILQNREPFKMPAHNIFFKYMYSVGLPAGLCVIGIIFLFIIKGWKCLKYNKNLSSKLRLRPFESAAIYAFIIGLISVEFVGGLVDRSAMNSWWFWSLVVLFFANFETKKIKNS